MHTYQNATLLEITCHGSYMVLVLTLTVLLSTNNMLWLRYKKTYLIVPSFLEVWNVPQITIYKFKINLFFLLLLFHLHHLNKFIFALKSTHFVSPDYETDCSLLNL